MTRQEHGNPLLSFSASTPPKPNPIVRGASPSLYQSQVAPLTPRPVRMARVLPFPTPEPENAPQRPFAWKTSPPSPPPTLVARFRAFLLSLLPA